LATKEWPDLSKGKMHLYDGGSKGLSIIDVLEWDISDLKLICATRYMNMILVDDFLTQKNLQGIYLSLDADTNALTNHLNFLWSRSG
jgi:hypothetical protein